jgi:hypothetical protein
MACFQLSGPVGVRTSLLRVSQPQDHASSLLRHCAESQEGDFDLGSYRALQLRALVRIIVHYFEAPSMNARQPQLQRSWALQVVLSGVYVLCVVKRMKGCRQLEVLVMAVNSFYVQ